MATLVSPGVNVSVVDESAYGAPGAGTVPLLMVATRQDKTDPTGSEADGIAKFTKSAQAGKVVKVTSQRELTQFFGNPTFTKSGTAVVQGSETSEYGLMAAYSYLGQGNQAFVVRADLNLGQLEASTTAPTAAYSTANTLWLDTDASKYGIHQYNTTTSKWVNKIPTVEINVDDGTDVGGDVHTPTTASSGATDGTFLVVVHVDNETSTSAARQMSIEYFYGVGGAWEILDSDTVLSSGETVTYDEHYSAPTGASNNDIWVKTTRPGNGLALALNTYASNTFVAATVQGISTTMADGAGAIGDFVAQDGSSVAALTANTAVVGSYLLDMQANTKATIVVREIITGGAVGDLTATTVLAQAATPTATVTNGTYWFDNTINALDIYKVDSGYAPVTGTYSTTAPTGTSAGDVWIDTSLAA